jgi:hypothetical protein
MILGGYLLIAIMCKQRVKKKEEEEITQKVIAFKDFFRCVFASQV